MLGRWNVSPDLKARLVERMADIALTAHPRDAVQAMARIIDCDKMDFAANQLEQQQAVVFAPAMLVNDDELRQGVLGLLARSEPEQSAARDAG